MEKKDIKEILNKIESGEFSEQEEQIAKLWLFQLRNKNVEQPSASKLEAYSEQIWQRLRVSLPAEPAKVKLWPRLAGIAAAVVFIVAGIYFFSYKYAKSNAELAAFNKKFSPGKLGATLTLANGEKIKLGTVANGEIAKETGIRISKTANGQLVYELNGNEGEPGNINTLSTAKGETYMLTLPDKSKVWLNAASSLTYTANLLQSGTRKVKLEGEAYFEISKDKEHPFVVTTVKQTVQVLGTHFNISSYTDEKDTRTTLLEGSVAVSSLPSLRRGTPKQSTPQVGIASQARNDGLTRNDGEQLVILKPGEQSMNNGIRITVSQADTEEAIAWKDGDFIFKEEPLESIMRKVSRWYNVEVIFAEEATKSIKLGGFVSRSKNISEVLKMMELTKRVQFKVENRKIIVLNVNN